MAPSGGRTSPRRSAAARAAINAVWYQKWLVSLRHRPEFGGGHVHLLKNGLLNSADTAKLVHFDIVLNSAALNLSKTRYDGSYLLSQAFPEGSPHIRRIRRDMERWRAHALRFSSSFLTATPYSKILLMSSSDGLFIEPYNGSGKLTVNGELHKLAHNVSFGHGIHAGIHWRSDTDYSLLLGEAVAISFLEDQMWTYQENFDVTITKMDGTKHHFKNH